MGVSFLIPREMLRLLCVLVAVGTAAAFDTAGGENYGIPRAHAPVPSDKCAVAASNDADHRLTVFAWGYDNSYWMSKQDENWGGMSEWTSAGGFFAGGPTVIRNAFNNIVVMGVGADSKVWYRVFDGSDNDENTWSCLGGKMLSPRVTAVVDPQGLIHVFGQSRDNAIYEKRQFANGTEAVWGEWTSLGGILTSTPAAIVDAEGVTHLFARGVDGGLWTMTQKLEEDGSLTWVAWTKSENSVYMASRATIVPRLNAQNLVEVVVRGGDKAFWHTRQTVNDMEGIVWSPWKSLGGIFSSTPAVQMNSDSLLTVYGRGPEKGVWYKQQAHHPVDSASDTWSKWVPLGGRFTNSIDAHTDSRGYINIFGRGLDRSIWRRGQMYSNKTVGFFSPWSNMGGRFRSFAC